MMKNLENNEIRELALLIHTPEVVAFCHGVEIVTSCMWVSHDDVII